MLTRLPGPLPGRRYRGPLQSSPDLEVTCVRNFEAIVPRYWPEVVNARFAAPGAIVVAPTIRAGKTVIIAAHGNSLRALVKHLDNVSDADVVNLNIPTGQPLIYELDEHLKPIRHYYLGDEEAIKAAMHAVAIQGKAATKSVQ